MILQRPSPRTVAVGPDVRSEEALKSARENTTLKFASQLMDVEEGRKIKPWHHGTQSVIKVFEVCLKMFGNKSNTLFPATP
jgi:hypothetical protein